MKQARHKRSHVVWFHWYETSRISKFLETESWLVVARGWGKEWWGVLLMGTGFSFGVMQMFRNLIVMMVTQCCEYTRDYWTLYLRRVSFMVCELCLNLKIYCRDFHGCPVVKTSPSSTRGVGLIPGWGANTPHALWPKNQNRKQKQCCNTFNKNFKKGPHKKKIFKKVLLSCQFSDQSIDFMHSQSKFQQVFGSRNWQTDSGIQMEMQWTRNSQNNLANEGERSSSYTTWFKACKATASKIV